MLGVHTDQSKEYGEKTDRKVNSIFFTVVIRIGGGKDPVPCRCLGSHLPT